MRAKYKNENWVYELIPYPPDNNWRYRVYKSYLGQNLTVEIGEKHSGLMKWNNRTLEITIDYILDLIGIEELLKRHAERELGPK